MAALRWSITILGFTVLLLGGYLIMERRDPSSLYFILGEQYSRDACCTTYATVFLPDGTPLTRIKGSEYEGDHSFYDLYWGTDGLHFFEQSMHDLSISRVSLDGHQRTRLGSTGNGFMHSYSPDREWMVWLPASANSNVPFGANLLWFMDRRGQHQQTLEIPPHTIAVISTPFWSPDSKWLYLRLCTYIADNVCGLFRVRPDGSNWQPIAEHIDQNHLNLRWSPDGQAIAMANREMLWIVPVEGYADYTTLTVPLPPDRNGYDSPFFWTEDSQWVIYAPDEHTIAALSKDGENQRTLTTNPNHILKLLDFSYENWSYYLKVNKEASPSTADLYRINTERGNSELLQTHILDSPNTYNLIEPRLTPEGWLIFAAIAGDHLSLYRMRPDGTDQVALWRDDQAVVDGYATYFGFMLAPNGREIILGHYGGGYSYVQEIITLDGAQILHQIPNPSDPMVNIISFHASPLVSFPANLWRVLVSGFGLLLLNPIYILLRTHLSQRIPRI